MTKLTKSHKRRIKVRDAIKKAVTFWHARNAKLKALNRGPHSTEFYKNPYNINKALDVMNNPTRNAYLRKHKGNQINVATIFNFAFPDDKIRQQKFNETFN